MGNHQALRPPPRRFHLRQRQPHLHLKTQAPRSRTKISRGNRQALCRILRARSVLEVPLLNGTAFYGKSFSGTAIFGCPSHSCDFADGTVCQLVGTSSRLRRTPSANSSSRAIKLRTKYPSVGKSKKCPG